MYLPWPLPVLESRTGLLPGLDSAAVGLEPFLDHTTCSMNRKLRNSQITHISCFSIARKHPDRRPRRPRDGAVRQRAAPRLQLCGFEIPLPATPRPQNSLTDPRLPYQHNNIKKMDTTHLNKAKSGSCPDSNRGPLATDVVTP